MHILLDINLYLTRKFNTNMLVYYIDYLMHRFVFITKGFTKQIFPYLFTYMCTAIFWTLMIVLL